LQGSQPGIRTILCKHGARSHHPRMPANRMSPASSYYLATAPAVPRAPLTTPVDTRVAIVGAGFAGLASARGLQERGVRDLVVLEAETVGYGASGRNGGFVFGGYSLEGSELVRQIGAQAARSLHALSNAAVERIRTRIEQHAIACDRIEGGALLANWFKDDSALHRMADEARAHLGIELEYVEPARMRDWLDTKRYAGGLFERQAFHFHPLKYAQGLARLIESDGGRIYEASPVHSIARDGAGWLVRTRDGAVRAEHVLIAGGGYLHSVLPALERARLPIATYVMVTEPLGTRTPIRSAAAIFDTRFAFDYYRMLPDTRLLWGGRISIRGREPRDISKLLRRDLLKVYPQLADARIDFAWGGWMSYARHKMPQIGALAPGLWFAQAFGGHGVAPTTVAGELLAGAIADRESLPVALSRYGLTPVFGKLGLLAAQATYSALTLRDALRR
jgi:glycine/D-amino acid oxidase-like deaminating enzyme